MMPIFGWLNIWLAGWTSSKISQCESESSIHFTHHEASLKKEVLTLFFLYKETERKAVHDASHCATEDVMEVWAKASVPTCLKQHAVKKIKKC